MRKRHRPDDLRDELQREELLKERWRRWEEMILALGITVSLIISGLNHESVVSLITHWFA
jgi:hypothetical protein